MELLKRMMGEPWTVTTRGKTSDNINLDEGFIEVMAATYGGTRVGRQELDGELLEDFEGALWTRKILSAARVMPFLPGTGRGTSAAGGGGPLASLSSVGPIHPAASLRGPSPRAGEDLERIVIGVDPPASVGSGADACGIVVAGLRDEQLFVIEDASVQGLSPEGWASRVAMAAARWNTGMVVAEANNGGAMVQSVLKAADSGLKVRLVHASRGKCARADRSRSGSKKGRRSWPGTSPSWRRNCAG